MVTGSQVSQHREKDTLSRLAQFTSKLRGGPADAPPAQAAAAPPAAAEDAGGANASSRVDIQEVIHVSRGCACHVGSILACLSLALFHNQAQLRCVTHVRRRMQGGCEKTSITGRCSRRPGASTTTWTSTIRRCRLLCLVAEHPANTYISLHAASLESDKVVDASCEPQAAELDDLRGHRLVFAKTGVSSMDRKDDVDDLVVRRRAALTAALRPPVTRRLHLTLLGRRGGTLHRRIRVAASHARVGARACSILTCVLSVGDVGLRSVQVHDPLLEAGKAKWNKQQAKLKKRGNEWAGAGPLT